MILRFTVRTAKEVEEHLSKIKAKYRRLTNDRYEVCVGPRGITLVPFASSRHTHVIEFVGIDDIQELEKAIEFLNKLGFDVHSGCEAVPVS